MHNGEPEHVNVLLHNDELTHMEFVVFVLESIFDKPRDEAQKIMLQIHHDGVGIAGSYERATARAKADAVQLMGKASGFPLRCTLEGEPSPETPQGDPAKAPPGVCAVKGWGMTGSHRNEYTADVTSELFEGKPVVRTWRAGDGREGFGAMCQLFKADSYRGKRVQFSAALRTIDVTGRAALCLRVDGLANATLAFDNMDGRPAITGTTPWSRHSCVVDVPAEAYKLFISNILDGRGELRWADVRFEVVDDSVPVTDLAANPRDTNESGLFGAVKKLGRRATDVGVASAAAAPGATVRCS